MKHVSKSRTIRFAAIWAVVNAVLFSAQSTLHVISEYMTPAVFFGTNLVLAGAIAYLRIITREPVIWYGADPTGGMHPPGCGGNHPVEMQPPSEY